MLFLCTVCNVYNFYNVEIGNVNAFFSFHICFAYAKSCAFHLKFKISLSITTKTKNNQKRPASILVMVVMNFHICLG
jgi:hypothetical protein